MPPSDQPGYLWHYELHRTVAAERLYVLSLQYDDIYDCKIAVNAIQAAFLRCGINSYVIWEIFGGIDLLVKAWLPATLEIASVSDALRESSPAPFTFTMTRFSVEKTLYHWLWPVDRAVRLRRDIPERHMVELNTPAAPSQRILKAYLAAGVVAKSRVSHTIKFFMWIRGGRDRSESPYQEQEVGGRLKEVVTSAPDIESVSLFQGEGFARYLISGRTRPARWEAIATELTDRINELGLNLYRGMRTVTYFSSLAHPVARQEQLLPAEQGAGAQAESLDELLTQDEGLTLEFKASAFVDVGRAMHGRAALQEDKRRQDDIVKSVTGLLNGSGGRLVIGVVEAADFSVEEVRHVFPQAEPIGECIVIGIEKDYPKRKRWDGYQRRLRSLLAEHISPDPTDWIEFARADHSAGPVAIIVVRRPDRWFYASSASEPGRLPRFYARQGNATHPLEGPRMDAYRERNPRTTG